MNDRNFSDMIVSFYQRANDVTSQDARQVRQVLAGIRAGEWDAQVLPVRELYPGKEYDLRKKNNIPGFTVSGVFSQREDKLLVEHSRLMAMDIDRSKNPALDIVAVRAQLEADSYVYACFLSLLGDGLAVLYKVPGDNHRGSWRALKQYLWQTFSLVVDKACPNESRLRFVSSDPELYLNEESAVFEETLEEEKPKALQALKPELAGGYAPRTNYGQVIIDRARKLILDSSEGDKHYGVRNAAFLCGGYIASGYVNESEAFEALVSALRTKPDVRDWKNAESTIRSGFKKGALKPLLPEPQQMIVRRQQREGTGREAIVASLSVTNGISSSKLEAAVAAVLDAPNPTFCTFWKRVEGSKRDSWKLLVDRVKLRDWYHQEGFCRRPAGEEVEWLRVVDNIVSRAKRFDLRQHAIDYVEMLPPHFDDIDREDLMDVLLTQVRGIFDKEVLQTLKPFTGQFLRDTPNAAHFFFRNCWVRVTAEQITTHPYAELPGLIWDSQLRPHDFFLLDEVSARTCDFHQFMVNISGNDPERLDQLQKAMGYLLHGYKEEPNAKCIIFVDQVATVGKPDGRTGKSLLMRAVGELVKVTLIPGAVFRFDDGFRFQRVQDDTRIVYYDEWDARRLPFKKLFTEITAEMAVNRKNMAEFVLPFEVSPKFVITTNDVVAGEGGSHDGRKIEIPLAPHYSSKFTPKDEFKTGFFNQGWDEDEYVRFFNLALLWVQRFLQGGRQLVQLTSADLEARKLEEATSPEFVAFAKDIVKNGLLPNEPEIWAGDAYDRFQQEAGDKRVTPRIFNGWMERFGFKKSRYRNTSSSRHNLIYFTPPLASG